ncbi:MAG: hypothetical protein IT305_10175 [Chloroflexi bacterium]|nr:hypothetical protein [Chloroflexota bacterium]
MTQRGFAEVVAVAEHVAGQSRAANALGLTSERSAGTDALVQLVGEDAAEPAVATRFVEIRTWANERLGWDHVPAFWRGIARRPKYLAAAWEKTKLVLGPGEIDELTKFAVALACASLAGNRYFVEYYQAAFRRFGFDDETVVELAGLVNHYASFNTVAHAFQLESPGETTFSEPAVDGVATASRPD